MSYLANTKRYQTMQYRKCGQSGVKLPLISVGLWHNFGGNGMSAEAKKILFESFDSGITHFDLANNYGPPYGCLLYTSPSPRDRQKSRMPSSA